MRILNRRMFTRSVGLLCLKPLLAKGSQSANDEAIRILQNSVDEGTIRSASMFLQIGDRQVSHVFGEAKGEEAAFLLGSISKPMAVAALMALYDQGLFELDDLAREYLPEFTGAYRDRVTIRHLLTHTSGLPDQLPQNAQLRSQHAGLVDFVNGALRVPLSFEPGTQYEYSSMAILLASEIAQRLSGTDIRQLVQQRVLKPLGMHDSALGVGNLKPEQLMQCQVEFGAVESGGGSPDSKNWDWNSQFWRKLGAPWGGQHASARDVGSFLHEFMHPTGKLFQPEVARLMTRNHNPPQLESRGLGFDVGMQSYCGDCSERTFGHTGSTGTIAWADPARDLICVVLTSLPARAVPAGEHPRELVSAVIAQK